MTLKVKVIEWLHSHVQGQWPWVSRSRDRDRKILTITIGFLDPETIPMKNFTNNSVGKTKIQEGLQQPPLVANVSRNSLVVRGLSWFQYTTPTIIIVVVMVVILSSLSTTTTLRSRWLTFVRCCSAATSVHSLYPAPMELLLSPGLVILNDKKICSD